MTLPQATLTMGQSTGGFERFLKEGGGLDFRLNEACWHDLADGTVVQFVEEPSQARRYCVRIIKLYKAESFKALLATLPATLFDQSQTKDYLDFFGQWWSTEDEQREGVMALHIEVIPSEV